MGDWFRTTAGVRQGYLLSHTFFYVFLEKIMTDTLEDFEVNDSIEAEQSSIVALLMTSMAWQEEKKNWQN